MSLNWELKNIKDYEKVCWHPATEAERKKEWTHATFREDPKTKKLTRLDGVTNAIIWRTMSVDIGDITEKNYREFFVRSKVYSALHGADCPMMRRKEGTKDDWEGADFTLEEIKKHIGLHTNVINTTRKQWIKRETRYARREFDERIQSSIRHAEGADIPS